MEDFIKAGADFTRGFVLPLKGASLLWHSTGTKRWALLPLIVNTILYILILLLFFYLIGRLQIPQVEWDFLWSLGKWLSDAINWLAPVLKWIVLLPVAFLFCYFTFTLTGMVIASPFNDMLSEKVEGKLTGRDPEGSLPLRLTVKEGITSLFSSLRFALWQGFWTALCLPLLLLPGVGALLLYCVSAYYSGIGFMDTALARNHFEHKRKMLFIREKRWEVLGLGAAMELLVLIPAAGLLMLPLGVTAGTMLYCDQDWEDFCNRHKLPPISNPQTTPSATTDAEAGS